MAHNHVVGVASEGNGSTWSQGCRDVELPVDRSVEPYTVPVGVVHHGLRRGKVSRVCNVEHGRVVRHAVDLDVGVGVVEPRWRERGALIDSPGSEVVEKVRDRR